MKIQNVMDAQKKVAVFHQVRSKVDEAIETSESFQDSGPFGPGGHCLLFALHGGLALHELGIEAVVQAGTCYWPCVTREQDDGKTNTHFGYEWEDSSDMTKMCLMIGCLPEIHVWLGILETQELVDFSCNEFPAMCSSIQHQDWTGHKPPDFLWANGGLLPDGVVYKPSKSATLFASRAIESIARNGGELLVNMATGDLG